MSRSTEGRAQGGTAPARDGERIQKALASAGVASRRAIEELIREGRITVNGAPAVLGQKVNARDRIAIDGRAVKRTTAQEPLRVLLYKKRVGELVTRADPEGRRTVFRKLPELASGRWIAVGRLDINTSGLLLLTNDGELARRMTHPSFELKREYAVRVLGEIDADALRRLKRGVELDDGPAHFDTIGITDSRGYDDDGGSAANRWYHVTLHEGRNRIVRRLFESQDLQVSRLIRVGYGPIKLGGGIKSGSYRELDRDEIETLLKAVDMRANDKPAARRRKS
jgi:23S rRNA pseudouridine2605 synthase